MLRWTIIFLIIAMIAGVLGFSGISIISIQFAKLTFFIFLALFFISLILHLVRRR